MNIIITGAGKGIGFELCKNFLQHSGINILAVSRDISQLEVLSKSYTTLYPYQFDLESDDYNKIVEHLILLQGKKADILINNAGYLVNKAFKDLKVEDNNKMFAVNYQAAFKLIQTLIPFFNDNAHVVNISSMGGFQGSAKFPGLSSYSASKAALACLTECLAIELKENNIKINCLCLGAVQTQMLQEAFPGYQAPIKLEQMADFITNFALKAHNYMNGKIIPVTLSTP